MRTFPAQFLLAFAIYASALPSITGVDKEGVITRMEMRSLITWHYSPPPPDDSLSHKIFDLYLKRLDSPKRFLLQKDVDFLSRYRDSLDDQLLNGSYVFAETANVVLGKRIEETRLQAREILKGNLNLMENDSIPADPEKQKYCATSEELKLRWTRLLKYQVLSRIAGKAEEAAAKDTLGGKVVKPMAKADTAIIREAVAYVARNLDRGFARMIREQKLDRVALYLNTAANIFDPHTEYFKPQAREEFNLAMTGKLEGIGAVLREDDGYIKVVSIVPGSASWRQKDLKAEDKIIKVGQGVEEPVDIVNASVEEAVKLIRGKKGTEVRLTVQKPNGHIKIIPLIRDVVVVEESYAKSAVLELPGSKRKIGYILLPSFYRDFSNPKGRNSSGDVKKELEKLKAKGVEGAILDLRSDGGGALEDAVDMGGLFIDEGPIVQVKNRSGSMEVKEDTDPAVVFSAPLVVLVNTFSASASEILAAAMQDYGRAVIVGSDTTFGKGTVQTLVDLDNLAGSIGASLRPLGTVKLTVQKFYRVNGGSTQLRGVAPDILLPDGYTDLGMGEKSMEYAMPWDTVKALDVHRSTALPLPEIKAKSRQRVSASPYFQQMDSFLKRQSANRNRKFVPLSLTAFMEDRDRNRHEADSLEALQKKSTDLTVEPLPTGGNAAAASDSLEQDKAKSWKESLGKDFYLREAVDVVNDLAGMKK